MKYICSLLIVLVILIIPIKNAIADDSISSVTVTNVVPVSSGVSIDSDAPTINLTENVTTNVVVTATVSDNNGCEDISSVNVKFYKSDQLSSCSPDANNCYSQSATLDVGTCSPGGADLTSTWTATIPVWYYAEPGNWLATVTPSDSVGGTAGTNGSILMATLTALNVTVSISYGELALSADTGSTDQTTTVTNTGNTAIGTQVLGSGPAGNDGQSMVCTHGSILVENEKYSDTASVAYASKTALTAIATTVSGFSIPKRVTTTTTADLYWGFGMPANGVSGSCSGKVVFTAI